MTFLQRNNIVITLPASDVTIRFILHNHKKPLYSYCHENSNANKDNRVTTIHDSQIWQCQKTTIIDLENNLKSPQEFVSSSEINKRNLWKVQCIHTIGENHAQKAAEHTNYASHKFSTRNYKHKHQFIIMVKCSTWNLWGLQPLLHVNKANRKTLVSGASQKSHCIRQANSATAKFLILVRDWWWEAQKQKIQVREIPRRCCAT